MITATRQPVRTLLEDLETLTWNEAILPGGFGQPFTLFATPSPLPA